MKVRAVDFVCYVVKDFKESFKFYKETLGLSELGDNSEGPFAEFDLGNVTLSIGSAEAIGETVDKPQGNAWVAIAVEDIEEAIAELKEKGVEVEDAHDFGACKMSQFKDPSGNVLMIHQRSDGTAG